MNRIEFLETLLSLSISHNEILSEPEKYCVIDIRNAPAQLKGDKIAGSIEIPLRDLEGRLNELDSAKTIVVYDWTAGALLGKAALLVLLKNNFEAFELGSALEGWKAMKLPLEKL